MSRERQEEFLGVRERLFSLSNPHLSLQQTRRIQMKVFYRDKSWELEGRMNVKRVLEEVDLLPATVLVVRNGKLLTEDTMIEPDDEIRLHAVISGG